MHISNISEKKHLIDPFQEIEDRKIDFVTIGLMKAVLKDAGEVQEWFWCR
jgi:hypothetical protein